MRVIAKKGLNFKVQGKRVTPDKEVQVNFNHDIKKKLMEGSLIDVNAIKAQNVISKPKAELKPEPKPEPKSKPEPEEKSQKDKKSNKEK